MVVSAVANTGEVPSFADRLGERFVATQPSGALLESLYFHQELSSASFFETAVKSRVKRLSNFRHPSYARATRLQRDANRGGRLALVSAYVPGRRLADMLVLARRGRIQPAIGTVVSLTRQLMTSAALLHDYAPDVFHGALGPERLVLGADGRLVICEYVLGSAVEEAVTEWGAPRLWRDYRLAALADTSLSRFGRRLDLVQVGLVMLSLLLGRPLTTGDYPDNLPDLLRSARETLPDGQSNPLAEGLQEWLGRLLALEAASAFRTLVEAQKAFGRVVDDEERYAAAPGAVEWFFQQCEEAALLPVVPTDSGPVAIAVPEEETRAVDIPAAPEPVPPADPFTPWPLAMGSDTAANLFETFTPKAEGEPSPSPSSGAAPCHETAADALVAAAEPEPAREGLGLTPADALVSAPVVFADAPGAGGHATEAAEGWSEAAHTARVRQLAQTLFEVPAPAREDAGGERAREQSNDRAEEPAQAAAAAAPTAVAVAPAYEWARAEPAGLRSDPPVVAPPAPRAAAPAAAGEPAAARGSGPVTRAPGATTRGQGGAAAQERRAPLVRGYDEIHKAAPKRRSGKLMIAGAAAIVLLVLAVVGGPRAWSALRSSGRNAPAPDAKAPATAVAGEPGGFRITTQPPGGRITIDGTPRGIAPLRVADLAPGLHSITVESEWGSVDEAVTVEAGKVKPLTLSTVGWIKLNAPVALHVSEQGKSYGTTADGPIMVPAGRHHFDLSNQALAVRLRQFVDVPPGAVVSVPLELPAGVLNLVSDQPAQVLLDGQVIGETPLLSVPAPLGSHEVIFRSEKYGEVSYTVNVTLTAPVRLTVNFAGTRAPRR